MTMITATRWISRCAAGVALAVLLCGGLAGQAHADANGPLAVVLDPRVDGPMTADASKRLGRAVQEALRSGDLSVVPPSDLEAILAGEPELKGCQRDECKERLGPLLQAKSVLTQSWSVKPVPAAPKQAPAKKGKRGAAAAAAVETEELGSYQFTVEVFSVNVGAVGAKDSAQCDACTLEQAAGALGDLVRKVVLVDAGRPRGMIEINSTPATSDVFIDGRKMGFTPYKRPAFAGKHEVAVTRLGHKTFRESIVVVDGKKWGKQVTLVEGVDSDIQKVVVREEILPRPLWRKVAGATLIGGGIIAVAAGAASIWLNGKCTNDLSAELASVSCDKVYDTGGLGYALVGVGAVAFIGGVVTAALPGKRHQVETKVGGVGSGFGIQIAGGF